jgi:AraC-like DNA-binding protein
MSEESLSSQVTGTTGKREIRVVESSVINDVPIGPGRQRVFPVCIERFVDLAQWCSPEGASDDRHWCCYLTTGRSSVSLGRTTIGPLGAGELVVAVDPVGLEVCAQEGTCISGIAICLHGNGVSEFLRDLGFTKRLCVVVSHDSSFNDKLLQLCFAAIDMVRGVADLPCISSYILGCYAAIAVNGFLRSPSEVVDAQGFARVGAMMRARLASNLSVDEMAAAYGCSRSRFLAVYRQRMGLSPVQHFLRLKVRHAAGLLLSTALPVVDIARSVGYEDFRYFARIFGKYMGCSPRAYRESHT